MHQARVGRRPDADVAVGLAAEDELRVWGEAGNRAAYACSFLGVLADHLSVEGIDKHHLRSRSHQEVLAAGAELDKLCLVWDVCPQVEGRELALGVVASVEEVQLRLAHASREDQPLLVKAGNGGTLPIDLGHRPLLTEVPEKYRLVLRA